MNLLGHDKSLGFMLSRECSIPNFTEEMGREGVLLWPHQPTPALFHHFLEERRKEQRWVGTNKLMLLPTNKGSVFWRQHPGRPDGSNRSSSYNNNNKPLQKSEETIALTRSSARGIQHMAISPQYHHHALPTLTQLLPLQINSIPKGILTILNFSESPEEWSQLTCVSQQTHTHARPLFHPV